uniref:Uncharacterized protein n=1 Tax=Panagrolaimus sp. ES5 TaxID=591445 RepID=A0AC34F003_9BILA
MVPVTPKNKFWNTSVNSSPASNESIELNDIPNTSELDTSKNNLFQTSFNSFEPYSSTTTADGDTVDDAITDYETNESVNEEEADETEVEEEEMEEEEKEEDEFEYCDFYLENDMLEFLHPGDV